MFTSINGFQGNIPNSLHDIIPNSPIWLAASDITLSRVFNATLSLAGKQLETFNMVLQISSKNFGDGIYTYI